MLGSFNRILGTKRRPSIYSPAEFVPINLQNSKFGITQRALSPAVDAVIGLMLHKVAWVLLILREVRGIICRT